MHRMPSPVVAVSGGDGGGLDGGSRVDGEETGGGVGGCSSTVICVATEESVKLAGPNLCSAARVSLASSARLVC